jgi:DNA mismatch repair protein MutL
MERSESTYRPIQVLPDHLANMIAAGEVIQRPASVAKELLENALDAQARTVSLIVVDGGTNLLQVSDDGLGVSAEDAALAFHRHATSKIASPADLEAITTFGFRGEALASVASVARVRMLTRRREDEDGTEVKIDAGGPPQVAPAAREPGTTVAVRNLFFNVPARRKFLRSNATEYRHIVEAFWRVALSQPDVHLDLVNNGERVLNLRPGEPLQRLVDLFGERQAAHCIAVEEHTSVATIRGFVGKPSFGQKSRARQWLFLNGRYIQNKSITHAVASSYEHALERGTFPFFILHLEVDPTRVDVNVHPAKLEAKFEDEQELYRQIQAIVRRALAGAAHIPAISLEGLEHGTGRLLTRFNDRQHEPGRAARPQVDHRTGEITHAEFFAAGQVTDALLGGGSAPPAHDAPEPPGMEAAGEWIADAPVWQLNTTYILTRIKSGLLVVDQHVAHERVLYEAALERLQRGARDSQQLLFPATMELNPAEFSLLSELTEQLVALGFDLRPFGGSSVILDGVPADVKTSNVEDLLREILLLYGEFQRSVTPDAHDALLKSYACRSAVKAGDVLTDEEMRHLLRAVYATTMPYVCPHGRPVLLRLTTAELDRRFGRR